MAQRMLRREKDGVMYIWTPYLAAMPGMIEVDIKEKEVENAVAEALAEATKEPEAAAPEKKQRRTRKAAAEKESE